MLFFVLYNILLLFDLMKIFINFIDYSLKLKLMFFLSVTISALLILLSTIVIVQESIKLVLFREQRHVQVLRSVVILLSLLNIVLQISIIADYVALQVH